jgi:hypothetical protein
MRSRGRYSNDPSAVFERLKLEEELSGSLPHEHSSLQTDRGQAWLQDQSNPTKFGVVPAPSTSDDAFSLQVSMKIYFSKGCLFSANGMTEKEDLRPELIARALAVSRRIEGPILDRDGDESDAVAHYDQVYDSLFVRSDLGGVPMKNWAHYSYMKAWSSWFRTRWQHDDRTDSTFLTGNTCGCG